MLQQQQYEDGEGLAAVAAGRLDDALEVVEIMDERKLKPTQVNKPTPLVPTNPVERPNQLTTDNQTNEIATNEGRLRQPN